MATDFELKGVEELTAALKGLNKRMANKIVKKAMAPISERMADTARSFAPVDDGGIKNSIMARNRFVRGGTVYTADALIDAGKSREEGKAYYAHMVEFGHRIMGAYGDGSKSVPPNPFWEPAFRGVYGPGGQFGVRKAQTDIQKGIEDYLSRTVPKGV